MKKTLCCIVAVALADAICRSTVIGESRDPPAPDMNKVPVASDEGMPVSRAMDASFRLFEATIDANPQSNAVLSPLGVQQVLLLLREAVIGKAAEQIDAVFPRPLDRGGAVPLPRTSSAVAVWLSNRLAPRQAFVVNVEEKLSGVVKQVDFSNAEETALLINRWAADRTNQLVRSVIAPEQFSAGTTLALMSAIYFKERWRKPFEPTPQPVEFRGSMATLDVAMMQLTDRLAMARDEKWTLVAVPYEMQSTIMVFILPHSGTNLEETIAWLSYRSWREITRRLEERAVRIVLPPFRIASQHDLRSPLETVGIPSIFDVKQVDFSPLAESVAGVAVDRVFQHCLIEVDREGTEAAAATAAVAGRTAPGTEPTLIVFDRPFLFLLVNWNTQDVLFVGQLVEVTVD